MPDLAWKKCKQTAFYHSLYSNFLEYRAVSIICVSKYEFYIVTFYIPFLRSFMFSNISALLFSLVLLVLSSCHLVDIIWYQEADNYAMSGFYILKGPFKYFACEGSAIQYQALSNVKHLH